MEDKVDIKDDWRYTNQERYLARLEFSKVAYEPDDNNDHEHCEFCFKKFSLVVPDALNNGWTDCANGRWICDTCFNDFADKLELKIKPN